ncbi:hypothetical protein ABZW30_28360 [Kitasatospora sp. NPDC004669]|uniref:hypothetical protein n=1 Tax=Kitasatospora sp. NPDC004669 TaxID=3154555 RepID=UPI0033ADAE84
MRTGRAAVFAAVCVLLASLGHVLMSGTSVPGWALLAAFAATGGAAWWLADRERGPWLVTGLTVGVQAVLHTLFSLGQAASTPPSAGGLTSQWARLLLCTPNHVSPEHAAQLAEAAGLGTGGGSGDGLTVTMADMPDMPMADMEMGSHAHHAATAMAMPMHHHAGGAVGMLAAHLLAAVLMGLWLSAGERAVFRLGRAAAARLFAPLLLLLRLACPPHRPRLRPVRTRSAQRLRQLLLVHAITSRGPPAVTASV